VAFDPYAWETIHWDELDEEDSNLAHCMRHGVDEVVVEQVLQQRPVQITLSPTRAEFVIAGPNAAWDTLWTLLLDTSYYRGDWLRPVTGWESKTAEIRQWEKITHQTWRGRNA
jgi:hypothetical protein